MTDNAQNSDKAIGFAQNYSYNAMSNGCSFGDIGCGDADLGGSDVYNHFPDPQVKVSNLRPGKNYDVEIYDAHTGGYIITLHTQNTAFDGNLMFRQDLGWKDNNGSPPSILFKLERSNCSGCRTSTDNNTYNYTFPVNDTFNLNVPDDEGYRDLQWIENERTISTDFALNYSYKEIGNYIIYTKFIDKDGKRYNVTNHIEITDNKSKTQNTILVYPNPSEGIFNIGYGEQKDQIIYTNLYDASGKLLISDRTIERVNISSYSSGLYFLRIVNENGNSYIFKIIKN